MDASDFERFKGTMTQKLMVNPQYKDEDISGISDDDKFKEYIYLNGIFFDDGDVSVAIRGLRKRLTTENIDNFGLMARPVAVYGKHIDDVKTWWEKQDLGDEPHPYNEQCRSHFVQINRSLSQAALNCAAPRFNHIYELFGGSAAYSYYWSQQDADISVTVCEKGEMYQLWKNVTELDWRSIFSSTPQFDGIEKGKSFKELFTDERVDGSCKNSCSSFGKFNQKLPKTELILDWRNYTTGHEKSRDALTNVYNKWTVCEGFESGVRAILARSTPCTVVIDPPYQSEDGEKYSEKMTEQLFNTLTDDCVKMARQEHQLVISESDRLVTKWYHKLIEELNRAGIPWISRKYMSPSRGGESFCEIVIVVNPDMSTCTASDYYTKQNETIFWRSNLSDLNPVTVSRGRRVKEVSSAVISHYGQKYTFAEQTGKQQPYQIQSDGVKKWLRWTDPQIVQGMKKQ